MLHTVQDLWREIPGLLTDRLELLTLELQRAGQALAQMLMLVVAAAILAVTAWLLLWGCIVAALVQAGLPLPGVLLGAVVFNLLIAWLAASRALALLPRLSLPATRRHLMLSPSPQPSAVTANAAPRERHDHLSTAGQHAAG